MLPVLRVCLLVNVVCILGQNQSDDLVSSPQCISNGECDDVHACIDLACQDPCPGVCHSNSTCRVHNHVPYCSCRSGQTGDPFTGCQEQAPPGKCSPIGRPSGRKVFRLERFTKINWHGAILHCRAHGGRLASIETKEENDQIKAEISKTNLLHQQFWTSGTNLIDGHWIWFSTGQNIAGHTDWEPGEPNNVADNENCLELYDHYSKNEYMWNDRSCSDAINPICEYFE